MATGRYIGRFAPSPTGPLHFGSLIVAVASYLEAHVRGGRWLLRIDDADAARSNSEHTQTIITSLQHFGFRWRQPVVFQSHRTDKYHDALNALLADKQAYPCGCTRRDFVGNIYPGTCRDGLHGKQPRSVRVLTNNEVMTFHDERVGHCTQQLETEVGDFVIRRADGLYAYHLATVIDDASASVTNIVRGNDLLDSTARQRYLQSLLTLTHPKYAHIPILVDQHGNKLSKQAHATPIDETQAPRQLHQALYLLGQNPPKSLISSNLATIWQWARQYWQFENIPHVATIEYVQPP